MQTTLRIDDELYREAKAEAARQGTTLTRFLESALQMKLSKSQAKLTGKPHPFRVFQPSIPQAFTNQELRAIADEELEKSDFAKLGISWRSPS